MMKRIIRGSVTSSNSKPKNAVWIKDGQDMKWKMFKGTNEDSVDSDFLSRVSRKNNANYIDVIVVPNGTHPNEVINSSSTRSKNATFKNDKRLSPTSERYKGYLIVLDRGGDGYNVYDKHRELEDAGYPSKDAAKKFIDELVADDADIYSSTDITLSTNVPETQMIDDLEYFYEVYPEAMEPILIRNGATPDKDNWLDGCNIPQAYDEAVAYFESKYDNDDEYSELDTGVGSRLGWSNYIQSGIYEETEDPKWICLDIKHVRDSDGMLTDYALYTTEDEDKYICMFGDVDAYPPDEMYADAEFDSEAEALEWFEDYTGPGDEDEDEDYDMYHDDIDSAEELDEDEDGLDHPDQEFDSADTSINSTKLPAIYKMISIPEGSVGIDFGGGKWDNAIEHIRDLGATLCVYDPYNRSKAYNIETLKTLRANGGADWAVTSNVLNVIKEPSARKAVLENISKITKSGAPIYITVYEGRGDGKAGQTKSGYQLNRKTADYLEEIQEVFPDAKRKGKLIVATNKGSVNSSSSIKASSEIIWDDLDWNQQIQVMKRYIRNYRGTRIFEDFADHINKPVEDIIDSFVDAEAHGDIKIPERTQIDSEYRNDDIYSSNSVNVSLDKYMNVTKDRKKYAVHYTQVNTEQDAWTIYSDFRAQVSRIAPYDDADYAWADIRNGHIDVIRNGKVVKRSYYFNADDMDVENTEWCDIIIDEAIDLIAKINKDTEPRMVYNSTSIASKNKSNITSSADKKIRPIDELDDVTDQLRDDLIQKLVDVMSSPNFGFSRNEAIDYSRVDIRFDDDENRIEVEVGAEVDYDGLMQIAQELDPIIQSYDKAAYFDAEDAGLLIAFISYNSLRRHMKVDSAADIPEPFLDPPEYDDPEEVDEDVTVEFDMDRVRIDVDKSGSWEYVDDSFLNDVMTDDALYSEEYDVKVRDRNGLLEDLDDILKYDIPVEAGEYRISCHITLVYHITGIEKYDEYPDDNYGDSSEYSTENADVKFDFHDSYVEDFRIVD